MTDDIKNDDKVAASAPGMTRAEKLKAISEAGKSFELKEAEAEVIDEDVFLTAAEKRAIEEAAESDAEKEAMIIEAENDKRHALAIKQAKSKVNPSVPARHVVQRPSYGPVTGTVEFHMRETFAFLLGRSIKEKHHIAGLFEAAATSRSLVQGYVAGCPYAAWYCCKIEDEINAIRKMSDEVEREARALINHSTTLSLAPFTSKRPSLVNLDFVVTYGFHFADLLVHYDRILRLVKSYELQHFINHAEFRTIEERLGTPLRRLFRLPGEWQFVGKDAVIQKTATLLSAEHRMGILPDEFIDGSKKPLMV